MSYFYFNRLRRHRTAKPRLDFADIKAAAQGGWPSILTRLGVSPEALRNHHGPCPGCGGVDRFRFDDQDGRGTFICSNGGGDPVAGDGFGLLGHVYGWSPKQAFQEVAEALGMTGDDSSRDRTSPQRASKSSINAAPDIEDIQRCKNKLNAIWSALHPFNHPCAEPARRYLAGRGLSDLLGDLPHVWRFHQALDYWKVTHDKPVSVGRFPALVAKIQSPEGKPVGLHQTYLTADGRKANVPEARKSRSLYEGALRGAAIRLYPAQDRLALAEGIETALSLRVAWPDYPVWSCISASGLAGVQIPTAVAEVLIIADADLAGRNAAEKLADRLTEEGRTARILTPDVGDLNDFFRSASHD